jgi:hypothetical protein
MAAQSDVAGKSGFMEELRHNIERIEKIINESKTENDRGIITLGDVRFSNASINGAKRAVAFSNIEHLLQKSVDPYVKVRIECFLKRYSPRYVSTFNENMFSASAQELIKDLCVLNNFRMPMRGNYVE